MVLVFHLSMIARVVRRFQAISGHFQDMAKLQGRDTGAGNRKPAIDVHDGVPLLDSGVNFVGEQVSYPKGVARIKSMLATMAPGQKTGWHKHGVPTYGYILEGQITVDYGDAGKTTYHAGEGVLEAMDYWHEGINDGDIPARVVVVFMGAEGAENVIYKPDLVSD